MLLGHPEVPFWRGCSLSAERLGGAWSTSTGTDPSLVGESHRSVPGVDEVDSGVVPGGCAVVRIGGHRFRVHRMFRAVAQRVEP